MFFPARFDLHEVQAADGYAYNMAVQRFNQDFAGKLPTFISTDAQGDWWGGEGGGTVAHSAIACFFGDTAEAMLAFSTVLPMSIPRIALVDFNNDCVADSLAVTNTLFARYRELVDAGSLAEAERYRLFGVRLDTSGALRDVSVPRSGTRSWIWASLRAWYSMSARRLIMPGRVGTCPNIGTNRSRILQKDQDRRFRRLQPGTDRAVRKAWRSCGYLCCRFIAV